MGTWGGSRPGAGRKAGGEAKSHVIALPKERKSPGRKAGSGKYGEPTKTVRVPESLQRDVMHYVENKGFNLPVFAMKVPMGLMKSSIDYIDRTLNLNELIKHPDKTFFHPVEGDSMEPTVSVGDLAMIDAAIEPMHGDVVLASIEGGVTLKRFMKMRGRVWLEADNKKYDPIMLNADVENIVCGVMLIAIRPVSINHIRPFT